MKGSDPTDDPQDVVGGPSGSGRLDAIRGLTERVLPDPPRYTAADLAERTGVSQDQGRRLWRALGFPDSGGDRIYTETDAAALDALVAAVRAGLMDFETGLTLARALGQTMARLADWEVGALTQRVLEMVDDADASREARIAPAERMIDEFGPTFEHLLLYSWRRHLAAAMGRMGAAIDEDSDIELDSVELVVGFADIVGFTALSNELSRSRIGDLVELFESRCSDVVTTAGGRVIKSIGDSVLFVNPDPVAALETAEGIINVVGRDPRMPDIRLGLASGAVVMRQGDVFGPPVNLAARLTTVARRNRIIIDAALAAALPADQFETRTLPARALRGFGLVEPLTVWRV